MFTLRLALLASVECGARLYFKGLSEYKCACCVKPPWLVRAADRRIFHFSSCQIVREKSSSSSIFISSKCSRRSSCGSWRLRRWLLSCAWPYFVSFGCSFVVSFSCSSRVVLCILSTAELATRSIHLRVASSVAPQPGTSKASASFDDALAAITSSATIR